MFLGTLASEAPTRIFPRMLSMFIKSKDSHTLDFERNSIIFHFFDDLFVFGFKFRGSSSEMRTVPRNKKTGTECEK
jgi:hypothetical protein